LPDLDRHLEHQRLQALHGLHLLTDPPSPRLGAICQEAQACFRVPIVLVTLID
jgi:hypothetical protein